MNEKILNKNCPDYEYLNLVEYCNKNNLRIEQTDNYYYGLAEYEKLEGDNVVNIQDTAEYKHTLNFLEIEKLKDELTELDNKSLRSLRAILTFLENPPKDDLTILKNYETKAETLRQKIKVLENAQCAESEEST